MFTGRVLTDNESLVLANTLSLNKETAAASKIYQSLLGSSDYDIRVESVFQLAGIMIGSGDIDGGIELLRAIVDTNPDISRVRLELARAYFLNQDYEEAEFHFQFVRATPDLPAEVAEKVDEFLTRIRQQKNWTISLSAGIVPDSNMNAAGTNGEECFLWYGVIPMCRDLETAKSGVGFNLSADVNHYTRFTKRFGLRSTIGVNIMDFLASRFDNYSVYAATGPRYAFDKGEVSLQPTANARWYGGDFYNYGYGLQLDTDWQLGGRWMLGGGVSASINKYADDVAAAALDGHDWGLYLRPRFYIDNRSFLMFSAGFNRNETEIESYGYDAVSLSFGYFGEFKYGFAFLGRIDWMNNDYHAPREVIIDNDLKERTRRDNIWQFYTRIYNNKLSWYDLVPAVSYTYTLQDSNMPNYNFDKHRFEFEIIRRF